MTPRERLAVTLEHKPVDKLCVDFGAGGQTGIGCCAVHRLREAVLGKSGHVVKVIEPYQMLGEVDEELRKALELDVVGVHPPCDMFGVRQENFKPFTMPIDGTQVLVAGDFNYTQDTNGDLLMYPQGDMTVPPSAKMPKSSYFWDALNRQQPIDESKLDPMDNCEEFGVMTDEDVEYFRQKIDWYYENTDAGIYMTMPGVAFGDIALVPATWMKNPKGIRDVEEWYVSTAMRRDYVYKVFEKQCEIGLKNIEKLAPVLGDKVQAVFVSGTDFGTQRGPFISPQAYRDLYKPFQKVINDKIHELTSWKIFIHSCGGIYPLIPDMIEAGFDVLNPVQCSATDMDPVRLKKEFGSDLVFWGGGVDTQKTLPFGTPEEVYREVTERIEIFRENSGFVFNSIHNVQSNVPLENMLAMFKAINDAR
ncbi:MAG: methyltransferase [Planctomycetes bacterium]|nr:methyltransferase [Planctomycetota bacterium]